ncbi:hypothetical protein TKK_0002754 [Trichogramma kaykai]|uniref:F-box domain-containing protein n=1 Tax=Trichogramma kaykai TaxID=54128 RepID=A0ABD2XQW1_9HYME
MLAKRKKTKTTHTSTRREVEERTVTTIMDLDDSCLQHIFSYINPFKKLRVQNVCKRWRRLIFHSWVDVTKLKVERFSSFSEFENVLKYCGIGLIEIKLRYVTSGPACMEILKIIHKLCPNIKRLDLSDLTLTYRSIEYLANNFDLRHIAFTRIHKECEGALSYFFTKNSKLRSFQTTSDSILSHCLTYLPADTLQHFDISHYYSKTGMSVEHLKSALIRLKNLKSFSFTCPSEEMQRYDEFLASIHPEAPLEDIQLNYTHKKKAKKDDKVMLPSLKNLKKLKILHLSGDMIVHDDVMKVVKSGCKHLEKVDLSNSEFLTDVGLSYITSLPKIKDLNFSHLQLVTDKSFKNSNMQNLRRLQIYECKKLRTTGFRKVLESSEVLHSLDVSRCPQVSPKLLKCWSEEAVAKRGEDGPVLIVRTSCNWAGACDLLTRVSPLLYFYDDKDNDKYY